MWINIDDRLPDEELEVFLFFGETHNIFNEPILSYGVGYIKDGEWYAPDSIEVWNLGITPEMGFYEDPTHWMLPEPPK